MDRYAQMSDIGALEARVKALESAQNLQQQSAAPAVKESLTAQTVTDDALSELYFAQPLGHKGSLRAIYDLGRQHGAAANSKPTPNDHQVGSSAPADGLVEMLVNLLGHYGDGTARAAIRGVADWLQQRTDTIANGSQWADLLREEANR
jgi:hypothetical protein